MCGICGFNWNDKTLAELVTNEMAHRGPDQSDVWCGENISLGHRRLSIIDLSEQGRQPMSNEDRQVQLVFNGEIYNFLELRNQLESRGHKFKSRSDSEVIIHAYEEYGPDCVNRLRGMFAFAIWDTNRQQLFIARDRIGIKPLYYYFKNNKFAFASEMKSLMKIPQVERELNRQAIYDYLGFEFVPAPETMCKNIFKLPAGHSAVFRDNTLSVEKYWDMDFTPCDLSYGEAVEKTREMLDSVVKSHLVSDVPVGVFLSGGLDSSALVAMMRRHISGPLRTFTIGYPDKTFSELDYAKVVADTFGTEHHILMIEDVANDIIEKVLWHLDEPMTDLSTIPLYLICAEARKHVTVCLSGEGGDESFAGYDRFKASRANALYSRLVPGFIRDPLIKNMVNMLPDQAQKKGAINIIKRFIQGSCLPPEAGHLRWQYFSSAETDNALYSDSFKNAVAMDPFRRVREYAAQCPANADRVNREIYMDMRFMMTDSVLMKVDKMSMANSLEIRVPLLDHALVELIASMPGNWKMKGYQTKAVFRSALEGILPHHIVYRGKQGYSLPVKNLLRGQLKSYMIDLLNSSRVIRENMDMDTVNRLIKEHIEMKHNHNHTLWGLVNVASWYNNIFS